MDVTFVHRLLKNPVHVPEYILFSEDLYRTNGTSLPDHPMHEISQDLEGIGPVRAYFVDVEDLGGVLPPAPDPSWLRRFGGTVGIVGRGLPYMLRLRRPRHSLTDLPRHSTGRRAAVAAVEPTKGSRVRGPQSSLSTGSRPTSGGGEPSRAGAIRAILRRSNCGDTARRRRRSMSRRTRSGRARASPR
jgi:hypothetical protein